MSLPGPLAMKSKRPNPAPVRSSAIYTRLKRMILLGRLSPGQRLVERELAVQMKVSRIPLRETLIRLESEGLVRSIENTATYVEDFSPKDLMEIYSLRLVLEPLAARLAAFHRTPELIRSLRRLCDRMTRLSARRDWKQLDQADYDFHHVTVEASQHRRLIRAYNFSQIRILGRRGDMIRMRAKPADFTASEHRPILEAIERGDAEAAEAANYEHVESAIRDFRAFHGLAATPLERLLERGTGDGGRAGEPRRAPRFSLGPMGPG